MITKAERLFEFFCAAHGLACRRVHETSERRPDYELEIASQGILAEVKQSDSNADEKRRERGEVALGGKPGERLRRAIRVANGQFKTLLASRSEPTLLVAYTGDAQNRGPAGPLSGHKAHNFAGADRKRDVVKGRT